MINFIKTNDIHSKRAGIIDLPDEQHRMLADEIKGEEEYNAELRAKKATIDDNIFDFDGNDFSPQSPDKGMGNIGDFTNDLRQSELIGYRKHSDVKYEDFKLKMLLGRGTFGKVFLAELVK